MPATIRKILTQVDETLIEGADPSRRRRGAPSRSR